MLCKTKKKKRYAKGKKRGERDYKLHAMVKSYFKINSLGVSVAEKLTDDEKRTNDILEKKSVYKNGAWEVSIYGGWTKRQR